MSDHKAKLLPLTGIRFIAALHVLLFHNLSIFRDSPKYLQNFIQQGYTGVSLFFILSGFILTYRYFDSTKKIDVKKFWKTRFIRIYPLYLISIALALPLFIYFLFKTMPITLALLKTLIVGSGTLALLQSWTPWTIGQLNGPAWSLSAEIFFYFLFPFILPWISKLNNKQILIFILSLWILSNIAPILYVLKQPDLTNSRILEFPLVTWMGTAYPAWRTFVTGFPIFHLPQFLIGVCTGILFFRKKIAQTDKINTSFYIFIELIIVSLIILIFCANLIPQVILNNGFLAPLYSSLLYFLAINKGLISKVLSIPILVILGEVSYSIYIFQEPIRSYFNILTMHIFNIDFNFATFLKYFIVLVSFSLVTCYIEQRILKPSKILKKWT